MKLSPWLQVVNHTYASLHTAKEDAFWAQKMGLAHDPAAAQRELDEREVALQRFLQDPEQPGRVRQQLTELLTRAADADESTLGENSDDATRREDADEVTRREDADELTALRGWLAMFEAHSIESSGARALSEEIIAAEGRLAQARASLNLGYHDPERGGVPASSVKLAAMLRSEPDERLRRAAWDGLRSIEPHVLQSGFLDIVRERNRLGRMLGAEDYYDWKTRQVERMSKTEVFALLDELEEHTRESGERSIRELAKRVGAARVTPWNVQYLVSGDMTREQDPYFPFATAIDRWGRTFAALGIDYAGAELVLDLVDRPGKYENGFMHGPVVAWREGERRHRARIHFTANAIPGMVGAGFRAMETLFHEGGHAAHFANIDMPAPCFGQEFAPTSVGFSETQSMFLDSLLGDADWQSRYARDRAGHVLPWEITERAIRLTQPFAAWQVRGMLAVCYAEKALYEIPDRELTPERALAEIRAVERRLLFLEEGSPRPVLAVPHLLAGESSAYYHGYVMAEMAVEETRAFFLERDGHLVDNPRVGPDLRGAYWRPGNSLSFAEFVRRLTGSSLNARALAYRVNRTADEVVAESRDRVAKIKRVSEAHAPVNLGAKIRVVHGRETVTTLANGDFETFAREFERWIDGLTQGARG